MTFKLVDLEDPESYRSILYGRSIWLQIVAGPGEPTWKEGGVLGARVHGPGMLPTVLVAPSDAASGPTAANNGQRNGVSRPNTTTACAPSNQRGTNIPASTGIGIGHPGSPISTSGGWTDGGFPAGGITSTGGGGTSLTTATVESGTAGGARSERRANPAVGEGNTDPHRPVGVPFPFKAAASKQGESATNETVLRLMNKSAIVNCRWTVRPVRPDGESIPALAGEEVSNMDCIYLEQARFCCAFHAVISWC